MRLHVLFPTTPKTVRGVALAGCLLFSEATGAPRIEADQALWDFGLVTNVAAVSHAFVIRNAGDAELEINRVISGCDPCLRVSMEKTKISPGGRSTLRCHLDLRALSGRVSRTVTVECNDPVQPLLVLGVTGVVVPAYQITPTEISLDMARGQRSGSAEIVPLLPLHAPLSLVDCSDSNLTAHLSAVASNRFILTIQASESFQRGQTFVEITVRSADPNDRPCLVNAFVHHPPDLEVLPARLRFQSKNEPQMRMFWLKQHGTEPLLLLDAIPSSDKFHCEIDPDAAGFNYRIYVTAWQLEEEGGRTHSINLKMRDSAGAERFVPVPISVEQAISAAAGTGDRGTDLGSK
jgi:hypothetical protein